MRACMLSHFSHVWLCDPVDCSLPHSSVHGILQARILEWFAMPSSRRSSRPRDRTQLSCTAGRLFTTEPPYTSVKYVYVNPNFPINSTFLSPLGVHTFVPHICVSIYALQIRSSIYYFLFGEFLNLSRGGENSRISHILYIHILYI